MAMAMNAVSEQLSKTFMGVIGSAKGSSEDALARLSGVDILSDLEKLTPIIIRPLLGEVQSAAADAIASLPASATITIGFDVTDPRALAWAERRAGELIVEITDDVRGQVRDLISRGYRDQLTINQLTREIQSLVGLHSRWSTAVNNLFARTFQSLTTAGMTTGMATSRATEAADAYRTRLTRTRAETIARTEVISANNAGRFMGWQQFMEQSGFPAGLLRKEWVIGPDGWQGIEVCEKCQELAGQTVAVNDVFPNGRLMPPAHPNCRCTALLIFPDEEL